MKYEVRSDENLVVDFPAHHVLTNSGPDTVFILANDDSRFARIKSGECWTQIHSSTMRLRSDKSTCLIEIEEDPAITRQLAGKDEIEC